jgi:hypothetical protein
LSGSQKYEADHYLASPLTLQRLRLVWPCGAIRLIAVAYASWLLVRVLGMWSDPEFVAKA